MREEAEVLENHSTVLAKFLGFALELLIPGIVFRATREGMTGDGDFALIEDLETVQATEERRFPASGSADETNQLADLDIEVDAFQDFVVPEGFFQAADRNNAHGG
jgi:hypothetical protein